MDNFIVSARKYRPATFATVVGQEAITNTLKNAIKNQQVAQAFLFTGPRGVGKTTCARILAKTINCQSITPEGEACNECASCKSFDKTSSFNIFELDAASNNSVDDIRTLVDQVRIIPQQGYKVYIIDEVHMLSAAAFNAFLKTLEEPPAYAKFILATTEKHKILPTILSRCQIFDFRRISVDDIAKHLKYVADEEKVSAEPEALHVIAQKADGGLRDALSMFDQLVSYAGNQLTYKQVIENLNVLDYEYYFKITDSLLNGDVSSALLIFNEIMDNGFEGQHFVTGLGEHLRNLLVSKDTVTLKLLETSASIKEQYARQSAASPLPFIFRALELLNECDINYKTSNNKKLHVEITLMQLCGILSAPIQKSPVPQSPSPTKSPLKDPQTTQKTPSSTLPVDETPSAQTPSNTDQQKRTVESNITQEETKQAEDQRKPESSTVQSSRTAKPHQTLTGLNIGNLLKGETQVTDNKPEDDDEITGESYGNEQISVNDVLKVWPQMIEDVTNELPLLQHTLLLGSPELLENNIININIENSIQVDEIFRNQRTITSCLRRILRNDTISIQYTMKETPTVSRKPYTDTEKFIYLAQKAPALKTLKDQLGLDLEM